MLNFDETFQKEASKSIYPIKLKKIIQLRHGELAGIEESSLIIYDKAFKVINKINIPKIDDIIQIKSGELLILSEKKFINVFKEMSYQLLNKEVLISSIQDSTNERVIFELPNGNLLSAYKNEYTYIQIFKKVNDSFTYELINHKNDYYILYSIVPTSNNNYAYTRTENYKLHLYDICFSDSETVLEYLELPILFYDYLYTFSEKILLAGTLNGIYIVDLIKHEIIKYCNVLPFTKKENLEDEKKLNVQNYDGRQLSFTYSHGEFISSDNVREFFGPFCKFNDKVLLVGDSNGSLYMLEYKDNDFCLKKSEDILKNEKDELKARKEFFVPIEYHFSSLLIMDNKNILVSSPMEIGKIFVFKSKYTK